MSTIEFRYAEILGIIAPPCPPQHFTVKETKAFRWVFDSMEDELNFQPQYFKNPERFHNKPSEVQCLSLGLSFFSTMQNAKSRFEILTSRMSKSVKNRIGKNVAEGIIFETDGVSDMPDEKGHFTLHPTKTADLTAQFKIIGEL